MYPIIDSHCHVYPDKIAEKAAKSIGDFYDIAIPRDGRLETLLSLNRRAGITHSVIFSVATKPSQVQSINNFISGVVSESGRSMTGLGTMHPDYEDIPGEIDRLISLGLKGIKLHPEIQGFAVDDYRCMKIYEKCEGRIPVLLHCGDNRYDFSNPDRMKTVIEKFPALQFVGAHFGGWSVWCEAAEELCGYKNLVVDSSSTSYWTDAESVKKMISLYTPDRVMFASDYPMWDPKDEVDFMLGLGLDDAAYRKIFYETASRIFDIELK